MFQRIRKHLTPTMFVALLALVFAVTGGAFAASGHGGPDSGSKTVASPTLLAAAASKSKSKGKPGPRGPKGPAGPTGKTGATGATGPAGAAGAKGENGAAGATGPAGPAGPAGLAGKPGAEGEEGTPGAAGKEGSPWTAGGTLPKGSTETGTWGARFEGGVNGFAISPISFPIRLAAAISEWHYVTTAEQESGGAAVPNECSKEGKGVEKGSVENPLAAEGDLCLYQGVTQEPTEPGQTTKLLVAAVTRPGSEAGAGPAGAVALIRYKGPTETAELTGSWAVTAP